MLTSIHLSVLEKEIIKSLQPASGKLFVDGTLGLGGHTQAILEASVPDGQVVGFEWDKEAFSLASKRLADFHKRVTLLQASYADILEELTKVNIHQIDGLVLDLGVSSLQLDNRKRGFSFQGNDPLDMRMNRNRNTTAADLVNSLSKEDLADIFFNYGEERQARRIAAHIVYARQIEAIKTTGQLAKCIAEAIPRKYHPKKIHVATKTFQALRIAVNRELDNVVKVVNDAPAILRKGARICIITFHSLEDRIVKQAFANNKDYTIITRRPIKPTDEEIDRNKRARSAKLRVAERR